MKNPAGNGVVVLMLAAFAIYLIVTPPTTYPPRRGRRVVAGIVLLLIAFGVLLYSLLGTRAPILLAGYRIVEDFTREESVDDDWSVGGDVDACTTMADEGWLLVSCEARSDAIGVALEHRDEGLSAVRGVSINGRSALGLANEHLDLVADFIGPDGEGARYTYRLSVLGLVSVCVDEWHLEGATAREKRLGCVHRSPDSLQYIEPWTLTVEYEASTLRFLVDGNVVQLDRQPSLPANSTWGGWSIRAGGGGVGWELAPEHEYVFATVNWVAVLE